MQRASVQHHRAHHLGRLDADRPVSVATSAAICAGDLERLTLMDGVGRSTALVGPLADAIGRHILCGDAILVDIDAFVAHYNHQRYYENLGNLAAADVYFGRGQTILIKREKIKPCLSG